MRACEYGEKYIRSTQKIKRQRTAAVYRDTGARLRGKGSLRSLIFLFSHDKIQNTAAAPLEYPTVFDEEFKRYAGGLKSLTKIHNGCGLARCRVDAAGLQQHGPCRSSLHHHHVWVPDKPAASRLQQFCRSHGHCDLPFKRGLCLPVQLFFIRRCWVCLVLRS